MVTWVYQWRCRKKVLFFLAFLDLQGVDQLHEAKFFQIFILFGTCILHYIAVDPSHTGSLKKLGLLSTFGFLGGLFVITWLSSRRIVRNYLHVLLRRISQPWITCFKKT